MRLRWPLTSATNLHFEARSRGALPPITSCIRWRRATSGRGTDRLAEAFGRAAAAAGVKRIVYLGGLGDAPESEHLVSRQEVGEALRAAGVDVVELRAAVVLGAGSISFEMLRYLTERLPFMVCPRWVRTAIQPIALPDALEYLVASLDVEPGVYEIGGAEVTTYRDMIAAYSRRPRASDARDRRRSVPHAATFVVLGRLRDPRGSAREPRVDRELGDRSGCPRRCPNSCGVHDRADGSRRRDRARVRDQGNAIDRGLLGHAERFARRRLHRAGRGESCP